MIYKKILKHGPSRCVVLPIEWCRQFDIRISDYVQVVAEEENKIAIYKIDRKHHGEIKQFVIHSGVGDL